MSASGGWMRSIDSKAKSNINRKRRDAKTQRTFDILTTVSNEIDEAILGYLANHWKKVAMVIVEVATKLDGPLPHPNPRFTAIAERIEALVETGHLDSQGNLKKWRSSEVRLAAGDDRNKPKAQVQ